MQVYHIHCLCMYPGLRAEGTCHVQGGGSQTGWAKAAKPMPQAWEALAELAGSPSPRETRGLPGERGWTKAQTPEVEPIPMQVEAAAVPEATEGF